MSRHPLNWNCFFWRGRPIIRALVPYDRLRCEGVAHVSCLPRLRCSVVNAREVSQSAIQLWCRCIPDVVLVHVMDDWAS